MEKLDDFRELAIIQELNDVMAKVQCILNEDYNSEDDDLGEEIWDKNTMEVPSVSWLFSKLQDDGTLPTCLDLHYTQSDNESSYDDMASRFILMDELKPIYITYFENVILLKNGYYEGLDRGFGKIIKAALLYHHYKQISL